MTAKTTTIATLLFALALSLSACSESEETPPSGESPAQADTPSAATQSPSSAQPGAGATGGQEGQDALMAEYQEIQQRLGQLQQQAMSDPALQEQYASLQGSIQDEMSAADANFEQKQQELQGLQQKMSAAQQAGDQEAIRSITEQGNTLQTELQQLQSEAMQDEEVAAEMAAFRERIEAKMSEIDPEAPELIERANEIAAVLRGDAAPGAPASGETSGSDADPEPGG